MWFWNKNKKLKQKTAPAVELEKKTEEPAAKDAVWQAIEKIQKELDHLKLAIRNNAAAPKDENAGTSLELSSTPVESALVEIRERGQDPLLASPLTRGREVKKNENEKVIEGVFDGECMIGADGEAYEVPANYASKSKLVEGDILKLTINNLGAFIYKQIKPIERLRKVGVLDQDPQSLQYFAVADAKKWKLLTASVTYFKGEPGDEVIFLIPAESGSRSAAVENIIKN
ncbi:hypothetical protein HZB94_01710 [Candidatus Falkowbacteria bacterium]|nr:hypothetical protein [Candidatus Falkowbacteria bacterium]